MVEFKISVFENFKIIDPDLYSNFLKLHTEIFNHEYTHEVEEEFLHKRNPLLILAHSNSEVLGFKLGHEDGTKTFYSWSGGVSSSARKSGIATKLMEAQHKWCKEKGYRRIQTKTKNKWREMIILNLKHGFDIIGAYTDERGEPKLILEKKL